MPVIALLLALLLVGAPAWAGITTTGPTILPQTKGGFGLDVSALNGYPLNAGGVFSFSTTIPTASLSGSISCAQLPALTGNVTSSAGSCATTIAPSVVTNAMLAGSIAASKLIGTDISTVGTITSGAWNGSVIPVLYGGLGQNFSASTGVLYDAAGTFSVISCASGLLQGGAPPSCTVTPSGLTSVGTLAVVGPSTLAINAPTLTSSGGTGTAADIGATIAATYTAAAWRVTLPPSSQWTSTRTLPDGKTLEGGGSTSIIGDGTGFLTVGPFGQLRNVQINDANTAAGHAGNGYLGLGIFYGLNAPLVYSNTGFDIGINIAKAGPTGSLGTVGIGVGHIGLGSGDNFFAQTSTTATQYRDALYRGDLYATHATERAQIFAGYLQGGASTDKIVGLRLVHANGYTFAGQFISIEARADSTGVVTGARAIQVLDNSVDRFVLDMAGNMSLAGKLAVTGASAGNAFDVASLSDTAANRTGTFALYTNTTVGWLLRMNKSRGTSIGSHVIVASGDTLGSLQWLGSNGTAFEAAATIRSVVDGTPGASADMPGRLEFLTSPDGSATPTVRLTINSAGLATFTGGIVAASPTFTGTVNLASLAATGTLFAPILSLSAATGGAMLVSNITDTTSFIYHPFQEASVTKAGFLFPGSTFTDSTRRYWLEVRSDNSTGGVSFWSNSVLRASVTPTGGFGFTAFAFANIATVLAANGEIGYCSDCTIANPCAGSGTGAIAKRLNGVNVCN